MVYIHQFLWEGDMVTVLAVMMISIAFGVLLAAVLTFVGVWREFGAFAAFTLVAIWFALGGIAALVTYLVPSLREEKRKSFEAFKERTRKSRIEAGYDSGGLMDDRTVSYEYENLVLSGPLGLLSILSRVLFGKPGR